LAFVGAAAPPDDPAAEDAGPAALEPAAEDAGAAALEPAADEAGAAAEEAGAGAAAEEAADVALELASEGLDDEHPANASVSAAPAATLRTRDRFIAFPFTF
jgi:hypothetical protein